MNTEAIDHPPFVPKRLLSVTDYHRMAEAGIFAPDERVELIEGEIVNVPPVGSDHIGLVNDLTETLVAAAVGRAIVSIQNPVVLPEHSEPEPDVALLRPREGRYRKEKPLPADVLLLIEVADSTLRYDTEVKVPLYASFDIPETWLIDVRDERLIRFAGPTRSGYARTETVSDLRAVEAVALPGTRFDLSNLF